MVELLSFYILVDDDILFREYGNEWQNNRFDSRRFRNMIKA